MNQPLLILALLAALSCCQTVPAQSRDAATAVVSTPGYQQLTVSGEDGDLVVVVGPGGEVTAVHDGEVVPLERLRRDGDKLRIVDEAGTTLYDVRILPGGGLLYPYDAKPGEPRAWALATPYSGYVSGSTRKIIGVIVDPVDAALASQCNIEAEDAFLISDVTPGLPAYEAGMKPHDIVIAIEGQSPVTVEDLREALDDKEPGDTIEITLLRHGESLDLDVGIALQEESPYFAGSYAPDAMAWSDFMADEMSVAAARQREKLARVEERLRDDRVRLEQAQAALLEAQRQAATGDEAAKAAALEQANEVATLEQHIDEQRRALEENAAAVQLLDLSGGGRALVLPRNYSGFGSMELPSEVDDRLRTMEERLARLEDLLEKLVESDAEK